MNIENMKKLRDLFLEESGEMWYDQGLYCDLQRTTPDKLAKERNFCGASACIAGHAVILLIDKEALDNVWTYGKVSSAYWFNTAQALLGLSIQQASALFGASRAGWSDEAQEEYDRNPKKGAALELTRLICEEEKRNGQTT